MMQKTKQKATKTKPETLWVENIVNIIQRKDKPLSFAAILTPKLTGSKYVTLEQLDTLRAAQPKIERLRKCEVKGCKENQAVLWKCMAHAELEKAHDEDKARAEGYAEAMTKFNSMLEAEKEKIRAEGMDILEEMHEDYLDWKKETKREEKKL
jgi:hypothetical protein